jgi:DNA-directed RNA polymerase specialized sigma24 family protein
MESMGTLRATSPASAAAWLRTVCRNQRVDAHRARHLGRDAPFEEGSANASTGEPAPSVELAERVLDAFVARIDAYLATASFRPDWRARRRVQGVVALRRLALEETLPEIAQRLGLDVSSDLLTKWVERGRAVILATIAHDRVHEPDVADFFAPLQELALERRADAGRPRPGRRRRPS